MICCRDRLAAALVICAALAGEARAHPPPAARAVLDLTGNGEYRLTITCDVAALVMQAPQGHLGEARANELRELPDKELRAWIADATRALRENLVLSFDGKRALPSAIRFPDPDGLRRVAQAHAVDDATETIVVTGAVPHGAETFRLAFPEDLGHVFLTVHRVGGTPEPVSLGPGETSRPLPITAGSSGGIVGPYFVLGLKHILDGPDHVLFVLGLFLLTPRLWPMLGQVTAFTLAHSLTLALSACGLWSLPSRVVEPIIALSVVVVAVEDLVTSRLHSWRLVLVFAFGLLHGMGFAGALGETGLPSGQMAPALAAFNVGVEAGQLAVLAAAFLAVGWFRERAWYRRRIVIPAAFIIAVIGLYWTAERLLA